MVEEGNDRYPRGRLPNTSSRSPSSLKLVTPREECRPSITKKVGNEDYECSTNGYVRWFELSRVLVNASREVEGEDWIMELNPSIC